MLDQKVSQKVILNQEDIEQLDSIPGIVTRMTHLKYSRIYHSILPHLLKKSAR